MNIFGLNVSLKAESKAPSLPGGDVIERTSILSGIDKSYIPNFIYKPPFGYPRTENIILLKYFAKNAYLHSVIVALQEEAAWTDWDIVPSDKEVVMTNALKEKRRQIIAFLRNPNANKEGFSDITKTWVRDICEIDSAAGVKIFNKRKQMVELVARDGGTFLLNPDVHGSFRNRADIILPEMYDEIRNIGDVQMQAERYALTINEIAAYYQYGWSVASMPVPFGKREVIYFKKNPRSDSLYGISPVMILADIIQSLVYGSQYNLDFYTNSNMPEGIISLIGAPASEVKAFKERMLGDIKQKDPVTGFFRKIGFKMPVTNVDAKIIPFQMPTKDLQIIEQQQWFTRLVWGCFGLSEEDIGITDNSNKAVSQTMFRRFTRKAVRPILNLLQERINQELIPEWGTTELKFKYQDYDIDEDIKKHTLYQMKLNMGVVTKEMIAEELDVDLARLKREAPKEEVKPEIKAEIDTETFTQTELEDELVKEIEDKFKIVITSLDNLEKGSLNNV